MTADAPAPRLVLHKGAWQIVDEAADVRRSLKTKNREDAQRYFDEYMAVKAGFANGKPGEPIQTGQRGRPAHLPKLEQRSNGVWYVIHRTAGVRRSTGTTDHAEAVKALKEYVLSLRGYTPPEEPTVADLLDMYREHKMSDYRTRAANKVRQKGRYLGWKPEEVEREVFKAMTEAMVQPTMEYALKNLRRHLGDIRLLAVNNAVVKSYVDLRRKDGKRHGDKIIQVAVEDATIYRELTTLKAALAVARAEDTDLWFGTGRAAPDFKMPISSETNSRMFFLTHDEVRRMMANCTEPHLKLFILLAVHTGARATAILDLRWRDVDFRHKIVDFGEVDHGKRRPRVKMSDDLHASLWAAWITFSNDDKDAPVIAFHGKPIKSVKKAFANLVKACSLPAHLVTPHCLKHTYISWLCMSGKFSLDEISDLADTTVQTIKKVYRHLGHGVEDRLNEAVSLGVADATGALGSLSDKPNLKVVHPTRTEIETSDRVTKNTYRPRAAS